MMVPSGNGSLPFAVGLDRYIVAQNSAQIVEVACLVGHRDQLPVAVSRGDFDSEDRGGLFIGSSSRECHCSANTYGHSGCDHEDWDLFHGAAEPEAPVLHQPGLLSPA